MTKNATDIAIFTANQVLIANVLTATEGNSVTLITGSKAGWSLMNPRIGGLSL